MDSTNGTTIINLIIFKIGTKKIFNIKSRVLLPIMITNIGNRHGNIIKIRIIICTIRLETGVMVPKPWYVKKRVKRFVRQKVRFLRKKPGQSNPRVRCFVLMRGGSNPYGKFGGSEGVTPWRPDVITRAAVTSPQPNYLCVAGTACRQIHSEKESALPAPQISTPCLLCTSPRIPRAASIVTRLRQWQLSPAGIEVSPEVKATPASSGASIPTSPSEQS
jgi:hypothetical protein